MSYDVLEVCRHVINYSNEKEYGISNLKLQKVLYFIQAYFLIDKTKNAPSFDDKIEAWNFGPVVPAPYHEYTQSGSAHIPPPLSNILFDTDNIWDTERVKFNDDVITDEDKKRINKVVDKFSGYSATDLVAITHRQSPWMDAYAPYRNNEITLDAIKEYFNA